MVEEPSSIALPEWLAALLPPGARRRLVDVGGADMHVAEWGQGLPVVMLHGNPTWGFLWRKVVAELQTMGPAARTLRVIVPDLIGLGLSDKPLDMAAHTIERHGTWVGALLDQVGPDGFVLVVQDWGGPIGLWAAAQRLDRLRGLVVCNTVVGPPRPGFTPSWFHRFARVPVLSDVVFRGLGFPQNAMRLAQGGRARLPRDVVRAYEWPLRGYARRVAPLALARMVPDSHQHPSIPALARAQTVVESFRGPRAIVWGDRDPILGSVRRHVESLMPGALVTRTCAGHFLQEEVPRDVAAAVVEVAARAQAN